MQCGRAAQRGDGAGSERGSCRDRGLEGEQGRFMRDIEQRKLGERPCLTYTMTLLFFV